MVSRAALTFVLGCTASAGLAQSAQPEESGAGDAASASAAEGEIVVTARRREESLQDVPLAVTALSGQDLQDQNISRIENLTRVAPSLVIAPSLGRANVPTFSIRGQRQNSGLLTNDPSVGIYVAEAVQTRVFGLGQSLFDLESIQVLKGPQGTLFGRNTTGGAILIQPRRPELGVVNGYAMVRYGSLDRFDVQGAVNLPLGDTVAVRLAYNRTRRDGYVENVSTGERLGGERTDTVRGTLLFAPIPTFSNIIYVDYFRANATATPIRTIDVNPTGLAQTIFGLQSVIDRQTRELRFHEVEGNVATRSSGNNFGLTNVTIGEISDLLTLKNIMNYRRVSMFENGELDGTNLPVLASQEDSLVKQLSEELQLQGRSDSGRLNYIVGGYYFVEDGYRANRTSAFGGVANPRRGEASNVSRSLFVQADYEFADALTLTLGGRYTWDRRQFRQEIRNGTTGVCTLCTENLSASFSAPTYTIGLSWQIDDDRLLYAAHRRGFRSGGFDSGASTPAGLAPFEPETVDDVEIGFKSDWRFGRSFLRANVALYRAWYDDIQRETTRFSGGIPVTAIINAASGTITGGEAEVEFRPIPNVELYGNVAYTDTRYSEFDFLDAQGNLLDLSSNRFPYIPKWTYRIGGSFRLAQIPGTTEIFANLSYNWQSRIFFAETNTARLVQEGYGLLSSRVEARNIADTGITVGLWANNITNTQYYTYATDQYFGIGLNNVVLSEPRTYGLDVSFRF